MRTSAQRNTVLRAIAIVNEREGYQIYLNRDEIKGKSYFFTLKSDSGIPGSRISCNGKKLAYASWHAHGYIFDEIFKIEPNSVIYSNGEKITSQCGNWQDRNIGSMMQPCYFSETSIL